MYTSVDLGSHSIKIVVSRKVDDKYYVLASTCVQSEGIKRGLIRDRDKALKSLKIAINNINNDLGVNINKVLLSFPLYNLNTTIESGEVEIENITTGEDIRNVIKKTVQDNVDSSLEVIYLEPIVFEVDGGIQVVDPKGLETKYLKVRLAVSTIEKSILYEYLELFQEAGLVVDDLAYGIVCDYTESSTRETNKNLGAVINIGDSKTEVAIFNKGIMLKGEVLPIGSRKIDKDISYIYKVERDIARDLKENFASCSFNYADKYDDIEVTNLSGERIKINQFEISQVVEARLKEILKSVKSEVNDLTNREISYIIVTGGITNMSGFPYLLEEEFDIEKIICNITPIGIRSNVYSTSMGLIKYINNKMQFREIDYSMFPKEDENKITDKKDKARSDNLIQKLESYLKS